MGLDAERVSVAESSGRAFLGLIAHVKKSHGEGALAEVIRAGGETVAPVFASRIRATDWHPYPAYIAFLHALKRRIGGGDRSFFRTLGSVAGERDLGSIFRVYAALASAERLIRSCARIWPSYYRNAGMMRAISWEPDATALVITGFSAMDPAHCELMEGWMIQTMASIGYVVSGAQESRCTSRGQEHHEFVCKWRKKS